MSTTQPISARLVATPASAIHTLMRWLVVVIIAPVLLGIAAEWSIDHLVRARWLDGLFAGVGLGTNNSRVVAIGVMLLGAVGGAVGSFLLLRKRSLMGDAVSHATLPGIGIAFMVMAFAGGSGKSLVGLLIGAAISGVLGMGLVLTIRHVSRIKEDAALGIVLSVFFGLGVAVLGLVQTMKQGSAAGLESFIYGKTASMLLIDAKVIAISAVVVGFWSVALFKEFELLCFDQEFAASQGWPVIAIDVVMMGLVVAVTVIGLQAVGLILVIALLIIPPAAARFWTDHLPRMMIASIVIGALSGLLGAWASASFSDLPAGAVVVMAAGFFFLISFVFGPARGVVGRVVRSVSLKRRIGHQHVMRALFELGSSEVSGNRRGAMFAELVAERSWSAGALRRLLKREEGAGHVRRVGADRWWLTERGLAEARRVVRNHRLWELYLITHADIAPSHVDRDADEVEHVLGAEMVDRLEALLRSEAEPLAVPASPHRIGGDG